MIAVKFSDPAEFLDELRAEAARVEDKVVRVTISWRRSQPFTTVYVLATALVAGRIVRLDKLAGEYMFGAGADGMEVSQQADRIADDVRAGAEGLGLTVRAGVYEGAAP